MSRNIAKIFEDFFYNLEMPIIPLSGKTPIIKQWSRFCSQMPTDIEYASFNKTKNIGVCLGRSSGLVALDIDTDDQKVLRECPKSPLVKRGKKGETRFFRYNGERPLKKHDIGIEILSEGNQTVIPPSIHPETKKEYIWTRRDVWFDNVEDLPILDLSFLGRLDGKSVGESSVVYNKGRNDKLKGYCAAKIADGKDPTTIIQELIEIDELEHGANALFSDKSEFRGSTNAQLNALVFLSGISRSINDLSWSVTEVEPVFLDIENSEIEDESIWYKKEKLPRLSGIAQEMFEYIYSNSPIQRTNIAVAGVMAAMSTLIGNKIHFEGIYPNLYLMVVSPSGFGKDVPTKFPYKLFNESGCKDLVGEANPASDSGIMMNLPEQPVRLDTVDEATILFSALKSTNTSYLSKMAEVYATLYTSPGDFYAGKNTLSNRSGSNKRGNIGECFSPYVSVLCSLTLEDFRSHIDIKTIKKGLGGRFMYFADTEPKKKRRVKKVPITDSLKNYAKRCRTTSGLDGNSDAHDMTAEDGVDELLDEYIDYYDNLFTGSDFDNDPMSPIYQRVYVQLVKIAIIHSCSVQYKKMFTKIVLKKSSVEFAKKFIDSYMQNLEVFFRSNLSENSKSAMSMMILRYIESKREGRTKRELTKLAINRGIDKRKIEETIFMLNESGDIVTIKKRVGESKKDTTLFVGKKFLKCS